MSECVCVGKKSKGQRSECWNTILNIARGEYSDEPSQIISCCVSVPNLFCMSVCARWMLAGAPVMLIILSAVPGFGSLIIISHDVCPLR